VAETIRRAPEAGRDRVFIINLSGRGDKDIDILRKELVELG
jgi:tryptophan synthase beta subunit